MGEIFDFRPIFESFDRVSAGFLSTIQLSVASAILSLVLGTILVAMRVAPVPLLRAAGTVYINAVRNTPLTLVLLFSSLAISDTLHIVVSDVPRTNYYWFGVFGLSAYTACFVCEVLRSGINTVPMGQAEASRSIGLTFAQSLRIVILPQAFRSVIAPLGSVFIAMIKNTTVVIVASYAEAAAIMKDLFEDYSASLGIFIGFAIGFMALTLPTGYFFGWLAKRLAVAR